MVKKRSTCERSSDQPTRWLIRPHVKETGTSKWREHYHVFTWPYAIHFIPTNMMRTKVGGILRMRKQNTKTTVTLDVVPERRTKRFPPRFRPVVRFCELSFRLLSSPTAREGKISRPLDHLRQIPFNHSAWLIDSTNFYIQKYNYIQENDECQLLNGDCTTEKKCGYWILIVNKLPWCRLHTVPTSVMLIRGQLVVRFCNHLSIIQSHYAWKIRFNFLGFNWTQHLRQGKIEHLSSYAHVIHTSAKKVISRHRKNENVLKRWIMHVQSVQKYCFSL